jgi:hypothetical protein
VGADERYVSFRGRADGSIRFYDSLRRRVIKGPGGCQAEVGDPLGPIGAHGLFAVVCQGNARPVMYRVRDRRTIPIRGTIAANEEFDGLGRYWIHLLATYDSGPEPAPDMGSDDVYLQWRTGRRIECGGRDCWDARHPRREYTFDGDFDLDSKTPRRNRWAAVDLPFNVLALERPYVLHQKTTRRGQTVMVLSRRGHRSWVLYKGAQSVDDAQMLRRRILWAFSGRRPLVEANDIHTHRYAKWRVRPASAQSSTPATFLTRYEALFLAPAAAPTSLYGTRWPVRKGG